MCVPLSDETEARLQRAFAADDVDAARRLLESDCAHNIAGWKMAGLDRIRVAVIRLSAGSVDALADAIVLAQTDFRDALVAAEFADDIHAHEHWWPDWHSSDDETAESIDSESLVYLRIVGAIFLLVALVATCFVGPHWVADRFGAWSGVMAAVAAFVVWGVALRPGPGFAEGSLLVLGFIALFANLVTIASQLFLGGA